jgi:hypothetical protein
MEREDILRESLCVMLNEELHRSTDPAECEITHVTWQVRDENDTNWHYRAIISGDDTNGLRDRMDAIVAAAKEKYNIIEKRG